MNMKNYYMFLEKYKKLEEERSFNLSMFTKEEEFDGVRNILVQYLHHCSNQIASDGMYCPNHEREAFRQEYHKVMVLSDKIEQGLPIDESDYKNTFYRRKVTYFGLTRLQLLLLFGLGILGVLLIR